ncbi:MAG: hypothetical protein AAF692_13235 [Pseudomonadota bacterium]
MTYRRAYGGSQHRIAKTKHSEGKRRGAVTLHPKHPAVTAERPLFQKTVVEAMDSPRLLIDGVNQRKIGRRVTKGAWAGMPIFTLTLEERATCPRSCEQWLSCYGNNMPFARRHRLNHDLIIALMGELRQKHQRHPDGFVVRAHVLGDFGSPDDEDLALTYTGMWHVAFQQIPSLRMFSYTAHDPETRIGKSIRAMNILYPDRCRVRFSGRDMGGEGAVVIEGLGDSEHVVCPAQTDQTDCCATCALCWSMDRTIEFLRH